MTQRISTAFQNLLGQGGGWADALNNGRIRLYTGTQPATADTAATGTLLCTITLNSGAYTAETQATATLTIGGASGSINTITVAGVPLITSAVSFDVSLTQTAADIAAAINQASYIHGFNATSSSAVVTIIAPKNSGAYLNGLTVAATETTLTVSINGGSSTTLGGTGATAGVTAVNGLIFGVPSAGAIASRGTDIWSGAAVASGTVGWMRFEGNGNDDQTTPNKFIRYDCSVGTSGADVTISNASVTAAATQTFSPFSLQIDPIQTGA